MASCTRSSDFHPLRKPQKGSGFQAIVDGLDFQGKRICLSADQFFRFSCPFELSFDFLIASLLVFNQFDDAITTEVVSRFFMTSPAVRRKTVMNQSSCICANHARRTILWRFAHLHSFPVGIHCTKKSIKRSLLSLAEVVGLPRSVLAPMEHFTSMRRRRWLFFACSSAASSCSKLSTLTASG